MSTILHKTLKEYWGYSSFRPQQEDIIGHLLRGEDVVVLMPTGGGKSLCYQLPSLIVEGWTLVISPLISLIQDQEKQLLERNIPVVALYSGLHPGTLKLRMEECLKGKRGLIYLSPERLQSNETRTFLSQIKIGLIAVDEAHCISQWGHDFRPAYLKIHTIREIQDKAPMIALTGTATPRVLIDIQFYLQLRNPNIFRTSFARNNIDIVVYPDQQKWPTLLALCQKKPGTKIVYVRSRRRATELADFLTQRGIDTLPYHAGLTPEQRQRYQSLWMRNHMECMVATSAFGMGVDKADVRLIVHMELPPSIEEYYQEMGRAGRDGKHSEAILLYQPADFLRLKKQIDDSFLAQDAIRSLYQYLGQYLDLSLNVETSEYLPFELDAFSAHYGLDRWGAMSGLRWLQEQGYVDLKAGALESARVQILIPRTELFELLEDNEMIAHVVRVMLRTYEGLFSSLVKIHEPDIAKKCPLPVEQVIQILDLLDKREWIHYFPAQEGKGIRLIGRREWKSRLTLDYQRYKALYQEKANKAKSMLGLVETHECRQNYLLNYFGEVVSAPCGHCDVCRGSRSDVLEEEVSKNVSKIIDQRLQSGPVPLTELVLDFPLYQKKAILALIKDLMTQGVIEFRQQKLSKI